MGRKEGNSSMKEGKFPYFVSLFDIGPYERQKTGKNQKKIQGGGKFFFSVAIILIYTTGDSFNETPCKCTPA